MGEQTLAFSPVGHYPKMWVPRAGPADCRSGAPPRSNRMKWVRGRRGSDFIPRIRGHILMSTDSSTAEATKAKAEPAQRRPAASIVRPPHQVLAVLTDAG